MLQRRLLIQARESGAGSVENYLDRLEQEREEARTEVRRLIDGLSVRVSSFFRDPAVFLALEQSVYPELFAAEEPEQPLTAWCVGCSRGQEAYSLTISLLRFAGRHGLSRKVTVLATDVDQEALRHARRGEYSARLMEGVPPAVRQEAFERHGGDTWRVRRRVREAVRFQLGDALRFDSHPRVAGGFDLVSCRNLLIYLDRSVQEDLILALRNALRPGGYLLLGSSETLLGRPWDRFDHSHSDHRIYRRPLEPCGPYDM